MNLTDYTASKPAIEHAREARHLRRHLKRITRILAGYTEPSGPIDQVKNEMVVMSPTSSANRQKLIRIRDELRSLNDYTIKHGLGVDPRTGRRRR